MGGKPCIRGLRATVDAVLSLLASGKSRERILEAYPYLEPEDIDAALAYAAWRLKEREEPLAITPEEVQEPARRTAGPRRDWPTTAEVSARITSQARS